MRIALIHISQLPDSLVEPWFGMVKHSFASVLRPDTEVVLLPTPGGLLGDNVLDFDNPYFASLNRQQVVETIISADRSGFDAACVHCFGDPGVREARSVTRLPVFGPGEAGLHLACQLGRKIAIIGSSMPGQLAQIEDQVRCHGLEGRLIANSGIRFDSKPFAEAWPTWLADPKICAAEVAEVATACARDGADAILIGCAGTSLFCTMAGLHKVTVEGRDIPVLDCVMAAMKTAEMAVDIGRATGLPLTSRAGSQTLPEAGDWDRVRSVFGFPPSPQGHNGPSEGE